MALPFFASIAAMIMHNAGPAQVGAQVLTLEMALADMTLIYSPVST